ncbi:MAG: biotin synthase BioB [Lentisphaeria bacterium]|nr:biotin synthase BioB [Lentisphaeria bacterium]
MINDFIKAAYAVLETGEGISRELAMELINLEGNDVMDLLSLANKVKTKYASDVHTCSIVNAKSGSCSENCKYCAQSAHYNVDVETYPLISREAFVEAAREVYKNGVKFYGIVTSGYGYPEVNDEFLEIIEAIRAIKKEMPDMHVCATIGNLGEEPIKMLAAEGIGHYNLNLQVAPERFSELVATTHTADDKLTTIKLLQKHGISVCCGGIFGLGETRTDRVSLAFTLKELNVAVLPINVLVPMPGTPLEDQPFAEPMEVTKAIAVFRLINPTKVIKLAAGRETVMKDFQGLMMLSGANGMLVGGYLTTRGRSYSDDQKFIEQVEKF